MISRTLGADQSTRSMPSRQSRLQRRFGQETPAGLGPGRELGGVNDQTFLDEELERAVAFHVDRVAKMAVPGRKHRNGSARLMMVVGCFVDLVANCELCHPKLLPE